MQIEYSEDESRIRWERGGEWKESDIDDLIEAWEKAHKAEREMEKGKWIRYEETLEENEEYSVHAYGWQCSLCGALYRGPYNFCPDCGHPMEEEKET